MEEHGLEHWSDGVLVLSYSNAPLLRCGFEDENEDEDDYENHFAAGIMPVWRA